MSNDVITVGSATSTGGKVVSGNSGMVVNYKSIALVGDMATCTCGSKSCRGQGKIVATSPRNANVNGVLFAKAGDLVDTGCGSCFLLPSEHGVSLGTDVGCSLNVGSGISFGNGVNIHRSSNTPDVAAFSSQRSVTGNQSPPVVTQPVKVDPNNMYWPPYNFTAKDGEKEVKIIYDSNLTKIAILDANEWKRLFEYWDRYGDIKTIKDTFTGLYDARKTALALGGIGVTAIVRNIDGIDYLFLSNYDKFEQTLLHGGIFKADNAQVVKMGLGALDSVKGMTSYVKTYAPVEFLMGSGVNGLKYLLTDDYTLRELGIDQAKLIINVATVAGVSLLLGKVVTAGAAVFSAPVTVPVTLGVLVFSSFTVWYLDKETDFQKKLVEAVLERINES